jgi:hypothetical protein
MKDPLTTENITIDDGAFVFCYRPIGEFAER